MLLFPITSLNLTNAEIMQPNLSQKANAKESSKTMFCVNPACVFTFHSKYMCENSQKYLYR